MEHQNNSGERLNNNSNADAANTNNGTPNQPVANTMINAFPAPGTGAPAPSAEEQIALIQRMNYHASVLPLAPVCPGAPKLTATRYLPDLN